jgi:6-phospho-3-hexuloisomerase
VRDEVFDVLSAVSREQMSGAAALFTDRARRWFCSGQGRSGLVAQMAAMRLMHVADSTLACLADAVIEVPTAGTGQFGGTLFEQSALLLLDAVILDLTAADPQAYAGMKARHTNLQ